MHYQHGRLGAKKGKNNQVNNNSRCSSTCPKYMSFKFGNKAFKFVYLFLFCCLNSSITPRKVIVHVCSLEIKTNIKW